MKALAALLVLLVVAAPLLAEAKGPPRDAQMDRMRDMEGWANMSAAVREKAMDHAERGRHFAAFAYANGTASGRFVAFGLDDATGAVTNFTLKGRDAQGALFASIAPSPFRLDAPPQVQGATLRAGAGDADFAAHNNPTGLFEYRAGNGSLGVALTPAPGANFTQEGNRSWRVEATPFHGHLVLTGDANATLSGSMLQVSLGPGGALHFLGHPYDMGPAGEQLHAIKDAWANGRLGAMMSLVNAEGTPAMERMEVGVRMSPKDVGHGFANVTLESDDAEGKAVVLDVDGTIAPDPANLELRLDGQVLPRAASADAVLNGTAAGYYAYATDDGAQLLVNVPHFSNHLLALATVSGSATESPKTPGLPALAVLAVAGLAAWALRRR